MNKRYFYRDPLAAAWMVKHFGMKIIDSGINVFTTDGGIDWFSIDTLVELEVHPDADKCTDGKFYIHPESLHILEPLVGDVGDTPEEGYCIFFEQEGELWVDFFGQSRFPWAEYKDMVTLSIIQRNGQPFIWPELETD